MNEYTTHEDHRGKYLLVRAAKGSFLIDLADRDVLIGREWNCYKGTTLWYAGFKIYYAGKTYNIQLHNVLFPPPDGLEVDHIDGNGLNCRLYNMRHCTHAQNMASHHHGRRGASGFLGVRPTASGRFDAKIRIGKLPDGRYGYLCLGTYDTAEEAARVRDAAAIKRWGREFARLNFPE